MVNQNSPADEKSLAGAMRNIEFCLDYLIVANKTDFDGKNGQEESEVRGSFVDHAALEA